MASYLTTATIGEFDLRAYKEDGTRYWDAVDPDLSESLGSEIDAGFALQPEIIEFLEGLFGNYPFGSAGGIVDDYEGITFALENQTRPIYPIDWAFQNVETTEGVFVHEIAHQWFGNSLSVAGWKDIWLNEGFATYAEWLWREMKRGEPAQDLFDLYYFNIPSDDPNSGWYGFWQGVVGDPGPDEIFGLHVYYRGAMTLHQLRLAVGDADFFEILERWAKKRKGDNVTTDELIALAEKVSGEDLDDLFETWLFSVGRPELPESLVAARASASTGSTPVPVSPHGRRH
jgi:aminopeptidase N